MCDSQAATLLSDCVLGVEGKETMHIVLSRLTIMNATMARIGDKPIAQESWVSSDPSFLSSARCDAVE